MSDIIVCSSSLLLLLFDRHARGAFRSAPERGFDSFVCDAAKAAAASGAGVPLPCAAVTAAAAGTLWAVGGETPGPAAGTACAVADASIATGTVALPAEELAFDEAMSGEQTPGSFPPPSVTEIAPGAAPAPADDCGGSVGAGAETGCGADFGSVCCLSSGGTPVRPLSDARAASAAVALTSTPFAVAGLDGDC